MSSAIESDEALRTAGWIVLRVWDFEVARELPRVVDLIVDMLGKRAVGSARWQRGLAACG
jgi:very-short-patch-repair endonuclease